MRFGLFGGARSAGEGPVGDSVGYRNFIDYVLLAEDLGYASVFVVEHHFTGVGQVSASLNLLSYLAARTRRIRLGTAVVVLPWHNPVLLAEQVATLDLLSNGRFDFGVGKGYRESEFGGFCIPPAEASERFDEAMEVLRKAWSGPGRFSHHGKNWHFENVVVEPRPTQQPHPPFWVGAGNLDAIARAGRDGYSLLLDQIAQVDLILDRVATYRAAVAASGHAAPQVAVARALLIANTEEERRAAYATRRKTFQSFGALARGPGSERYLDPSKLTDQDIANDDAALLGSPAEIVAQLKRLEAGGVDYVILVDPAGSQDHLRLFAEEVMPEFAASGSGRRAAE
jgi:alkanesulfonate monooxygenase SsuD/methylene tetrahydromethanopterin reductase-like flavin-dependent oxidoreductase (luciferase family)